MQEIVEEINNIGIILKKLEVKKIFLVIDASYNFLNIKNDIERLDVEKVVFDGFTPNPLYEDVCKGVKLFNSQGCEAIIAVGGGSSIDVAKCIKLYCKMDHSRNYLQQECFDSKVPIIAVPTTAGTGSESTRYAVIYFEGKKQSVTHASIVPDYAVLEPSVLKTLPLYQKKCTMLDALCQGIESMWSVNSTEESRGYSAKAIDLIVNNWKEYIFENDEEAARNIMLAANYGGRAINITQTTAAHAMSYKITSMYKLPHGHAVAVCLPEVWQYMLNNTDKCIDPRGEGYLIEILREIDGRISLGLFNQMVKDMEMGYPISADRVNEIDILTASVNPVRLKNNPVVLSSKVLKGLYERIIK